MMLSKDQLDEIFAIAPSWTSIEERQLLSKLAKEVPTHEGNIVEIGCLYGGATAVLAASSPSSLVVSIDNFSWTPEGYPPASMDKALENMKIMGLSNVAIMDMTSREASTRLNNHIDLLWIDGGHDFKSVYRDLYHFSKYSDVIALHDYDNPLWKSIRQAVEVFLKDHPQWRVDEVVGMIVVLRKVK